MAHSWGYGCRTAVLWRHSTRPCRKATPVASGDHPQGCVCLLRRASLLPFLVADDGRVHLSGALLGLWLQTRWSVAKPDPDTPHGQSSRGAVEGEGRLPMASAAACYLLLWLHARFKTCNNLLLNKIVNSKKSQCCPALHGAYYSDSKNVVYFFLMLASSSCIRRIAS